MIQQSHCWAYTLRKPEGKVLIVSCFLVFLLESIQLRNASVLRNYSLSTTMKPSDNTTLTCSIFQRSGNNCFLHGFQTVKSQELLWDLSVAHMLL